MKYNLYLRYFFWGIMTTGVNVSAYYIFANCIEIPYLISNLLAWLLSVSFAFFTNKYFVFDSNTKRSAVKNYFYFIGSRVLTGCLDMTLMYILITMISVNDVISKILVNIIVIIANFLVSKYYIFR